MKKILLIVFFLFAGSFSNRVFGQDSTRIRVDSLTLAIQHQTDDKKRAGLYFLRGIDEETLMLPDSAMDDYTKAIGLNPQLKQAYVARGTLYEDKKKLAEAIKDDEIAITLYKDNKAELAYLYGRIGLVQWELKHYPEALTADSIADQLNPGDGFARVNIGFVHFATKNYERAIQDFTIGMQDYKNNLKKLSIIVGARADAERNFKKYKDAINDYLYALDIYPKNRASRWNLALSYKLTGDYLKAEAEYNKTISLFAGDNGYLAKLCDEKAMLKIEERNYKAALQDDSVAISFDKNFGRAYNTMASAYMQNGDFKPAIDTYLLALTHNRDDKAESSTIYDAIADAYYFLGMFDKSVEASNSAISLRDSSAVTFFYRGRSYLKLKDNNRAVADFNKVLSMDTSKRSYEYVFALFYTGKPDEAIKSIQKSITDTTSNYLMQGHYYNMACLYALLNKTDEANRYLKKCVDGGYSKKYALADPDLDNIKNTLEFKDIVK